MPKKRVPRPHGYADEAFFEAMGLGILEIDNQGRIWRLLHQQVNRWTGKIKLVPIKRRRMDRLSNIGYRLVHINLNGIRYGTGAHRVVWRCLVGPIPALMTINHKNGKRHDNTPSNLEVATHSEQSRHAVHVLGWKSYKNMLGKNSQPGERNAMSKITERVARAIRTSEKVRGSSVRLARKYGISTANVSRIRNNEMWTHL